MTELDEARTVDVAGGCSSPSRSPWTSPSRTRPTCSRKQHGTNLDDDDEWVVGDLSRLAQ
jgi:hypothetical protein